MTSISELIELTDKLKIDTKYNRKYDIKSIIKIQSYIRRFLVIKKFLIPSSKYQTKVWRKNRVWYKTGKCNECEKYQINIIEKIIKKKWIKTDERLNILESTLINIKHPLKLKDGFNYTENFDGKLLFNDNEFYFNLKFICESGGAQTRSTREVYHFINIQIKYLIKSKKINKYFINILDGKYLHDNMDKFKYLINQSCNKYIEKYIFIGDLSQFQIYWIKSKYH